VSLAQLGDIDAAVGAHGKATDRGIGSSDEPQFWYGMGFTLFNAGRWEEALGAFDKTLEIAEPGSMEYEQAQNGRRYCLQNLGQKA
jgi:tetratricopeptide (TPR) repeat protein